MLNRSLQWFASHRLEMAVAFLSIALLIFAALPQMLVTIDAGHTGVRWSRFFGGTVMGPGQEEGTAIKFPWDKIAVYDLRMQRAGAEYDSLSNNGLQVSVSVVFRYHVRKKHIADLHKIIGPDYLNVLLIPEMGAHVRNVMSSHSPEQLYSADRYKIQTAVLKSINSGISVTSSNDKYEIRDYIFVDDVLVTNIELPETVRNAIVNKESAKQMAFTYDHKLDIEEKEKQRKKIEAEGIRDFQSTITMGISEKYLKWEGIRATLKLAESDNSKVVIIGGGENGLPIILGQDYTSSSKPDIQPVQENTPEEQMEPDPLSTSPVPPADKSVRSDKDVRSEKIKAPSSDEVTAPLNKPNTSEYEVPPSSDDVAAEPFDISPSNSIGDATPPQFSASPYETTQPPGN